MNRLSMSLSAAAMLGAMAQWGANAKDTTSKIKPPTRSSEQAMIYKNSVPKNFKTHIIAVTEQDKARAQKIIEVYKMLETEPTPEKMLKYVSDTYIQHSTTVPDGAHPISMMFAYSVAKYPVAIDVHKVIVSGDWAMAHVNFRNLETTNPKDLGTAAVDMYLFGADGRIEEHWDVLQGVPTHSANPHGMFLKVFKNKKKD